MFHQIKKTTTYHYVISRVHRALGCVIISRTLPFLSCVLQAHVRCKHLIHTLHITSHQKQNAGQCKTDRWPRWFQPLHVTRNVLSHKQYPPPPPHNFALLVGLEQREGLCKRKLWTRKKQNQKGACAQIYILLYCLSKISILFNLLNVLIRQKQLIIHSLHKQWQVLSQTFLRRNGNQHPELMLNHTHTVNMNGTENSNCNAEYTVHWWIALAVPDSGDVPSDRKGRAVQ